LNERTDVIEQAIAGRRSVRAFKPDPVARELVTRILDVAARAPSGTNMQPWRVYVLAGATKDLLSKALVEEHAAGTPDVSSAEYRYYPAQFFEPYLTRRRKVGFDLYGVLGIQRGDTEAMRRQHARNFVFFDAPVGLIFTMDRRLEIGSWLDYGMFLQNVMIAARAHELETCAQAAFAPFHQTVRRYVPIPDSEILLCGMSLGYEDTDAPENRLRTERNPAREFAQFLGWDDRAG
jgi:nitroreductase